MPGCGGHPRAGHLMCRSCWAMVPKEKQAAVYSTWRAFTRQPRRDADARGAALDAYSEAADAAVKAVEEARP